MANANDVKERDYLAEELQRRDDQLSAEIEHARTAYLNSLPGDSEWITAAEQRERLREVKPAIGYHALLLAVDGLTRDGLIEEDGVGRYVRRSPTES